MAALTLTVPEQLLNLPERGKNTGGEGSPSRVPDATAARNIVGVATREDQARSWQRAVTKGQYDGNAPFNQAKLVKEGNGYVTNVNWLGMEGRIDGARIPYYALFSGVPTYVTASAPYEAKNDPDCAKWEQEYAKFWTEVHNRWKEFIPNMQNQQFWMLFEGWGALIREDDSDWRFRSVEAKDVLVPQGSPSFISSRIPWIAVRISYRIHELYDKIRNEDAARSAGWNVEAVQDAIKWNTRGYGGGYPYREQQWEVWQQKFKNREFEASYTEADLIYCDHLYVQEYGGKVSHFIFVEGGDASPKRSIADFLFKRTHHYDSYDQCIHVAFQNTGDGTWHSVRGMAMKALKAEATMDRLQNRIVDNAFFNSSLVLQPSDSRSKDRRQLAVQHGIIWIPPGTNCVERSNVSGQMEGALAVHRHIDNQLSQKLGNFQQRSIGRDDGRGEQPTATQVQFAAQKEASLSNGQIDNYYLDLDTIYQESDRRLKKSGDSEAKWFREQCEACGIPKEVFQKMTVRANRVSGYGSPAMRKMALQESMNLVPMFNAEGKENWLNEAISSIAGPDKIRIWNPPLPQPDLDDALIVLENGAIRQGEQPVIVSGMNNRKHLEGHLADAEERLAPIHQAIEMQQADPEELQEAVNYASVLGMHAEDHLQRLRGDPSEKQYVDLFEEKLENLFGFRGDAIIALRKAQNQLRQQALEQQAATGLSAMDQARMQSMQAEIQRKDFETEADIQRKNAKAAADQQRKNWQAGQQTKLKAAQTQSDITLKRATTANDIAVKRLNGKGNGKSKSA